MGKLREDVRTLTSKPPGRAVALQSGPTCSCGIVLGWWPQFSKALPVMAL